MTHDSQPPGEQPERRLRPDGRPPAPDTEPTPTAAGAEPHDDIDDEGYDPEHFEDL